jgi:hypothetical protein
MIRSAWVDTYLQTQEMLGLKEGQGVSAEDAAVQGFRDAPAGAASQRGTVTTEEDKIEFAAFEQGTKSSTESMPPSSICTSATRKPKPSSCSTSN